MTELDPNYDYVQDDDYPWALLGTPKPVAHQIIESAMNTSARVAKEDIIKDLILYRREHSQEVNIQTMWEDESKYLDALLNEVENG